jgi:hypothetical protein
MKHNIPLQPQQYSLGGKSMTARDWRNLLGNDVVLLGWPAGSKGTSKPWGHLTAADMTDAYLSKLDQGNIGVALGRVSGNLVVIDIDVEELVEPMLASNPQLKATLRTRGARGQVFWLRMADEYPAKTIKLLTHSGVECGEWRAGKNTQSIISGIHPKTGKPYQVVNMAAPRLVDFGSIAWPPEISNPPTIDTLLTVTGTEDTKDTEETDEPEEMSETQVLAALSGSSVSSVPEWVFSVHSEEDVLRLAQPTKVHNNYRLALVLARGVKALEMIRGKMFTPDEHRKIHAQWISRATKFLRPGQSHEEYFLEYLNAYKLAKFPLGSLAIAKAVAAAKANPQVLPWTSNADLQFLAAICRELQIAAGTEPFYLSNRTVQAIFNHETHSIGAKWLRCFVVMGTLKEISKGKGIRASRYRYFSPR